MPADHAVGLSGAARVSSPFRFPSFELPEFPALWEAWTSPFAQFPSTSTLSLSVIIVTTMSSLLSSSLTSIFSSAYTTIVNKIKTYLVLTATFESGDESFKAMMTYLEERKVWNDVRGLGIYVVSERDANVLPSELPIPLQMSRNIRGGRGRYYAKSNTIAPSKSAGKKTESVLVMNPHYGEAALFRWNNHFLRATISASTNPVSHSPRTTRNQGQTNNGYPQMIPPGGKGGPRENLKVEIFLGTRKTLRALVHEARSAYEAVKEEESSYLSVIVADAYGSWQVTPSVFAPSPSPRPSAYSALLRRLPPTLRLKRSLSSVYLPEGVLSGLVQNVQDFLDSEKWYSDRGIPWRRGWMLHGVPGSGKTSAVRALAGELNLDVYIIQLSRPNLDDTILDELIGRVPAKSILLLEDIDVAFTLNRNLSAPASSSPGAPARGGGITLSGLLNALDGANSSEGRLFFATSNADLATLDPALMRPGRIDRVVEFTYAISSQIRALWDGFYGIPPAPPASLTISITEEKEPGNEEIEDKEKRQQKMRERAAEVRDFREKFVDLVPSGKYTLAQIQGFLLEHKEDCEGAVNGVQKWIELNPSNAASA